jgi:hypothetical protein
MVPALQQSYAGCKNSQWNACFMCVLTVICITKGVLHLAALACLTQPNYRGAYEHALPTDHNWPLGAKLDPEGLPGSISSSICDLIQDVTLVIPNRAL